MKIELKRYRCSFIPGSSKSILIVIAISGVIALFSRCGNDSSGAASVPDIVDFNYHVRPILSDRCFKCHGPDAAAREANLRLDTEAGAFAALSDDSLRHVVVAGDPLNSELYLRVSSTDTSFLMPPPASNLKLNPTEIEILRKWIKQGAKYKKHWALLSPIKPEPPKTKNDWVLNEIDQFILAKIKEAGLKPNPEAEKEQLLKRASLDLTGLPPSLELQEKFLSDESPNAYEHLLDTLLANPHYGEKMAIPWLDVARYADSHGYQDDGYRTMWPWRDWVIHAFNANYPYDKFITWQLAGDLLPDAGKEQLLASGFNRNHKITQEGGVIDEEYRLEYITDRTNTFGKAFLSMTFECAKCHDHKYDPISQKEYYGTFAFFNQVNEKGLTGDISLASLADPPNMQISSQDIKDVLQFINKKDTAAVSVMIMKDSSQRRVTRVLNRGVYDQPGDTVQMALPVAILPYDSNTYATNRLGLAQWLLDKKNPLTARVFVNRLWLEFFGRGLVKSVGDFGMQGDLPTHPQLLDWLAEDFREHGWDIKRLIKQMMMSATYRQSAAMSRKKFENDPENKWFARAPRLRLTAELTRDLILYSSGLMNTEIGGPSVKPYQPKGIWESSTSGRGQLSRYIQDHGDKLYRRGMYTFIKRTAPPPSMLIFDASTRDQCEVTRLRTNTPLQALVILNDPQVLEAARVLSTTLIREQSSDDEKVMSAFRRILCRMPAKDEIKSITTYYKKELERFGADKTRAQKFLQTGEFPAEKDIDPVKHAALMQVVHMLYNLEEATTKT